MTETGIVSCFGEQELYRTGSVGKPCPGFEARIADDNGQPLAHMRPGEIWLKGPSISQSSWSDTEATNDAFSDGWFRTGDIGYADNDGYIYIVDRKKDLIIAGGFNIYPREIEEVLYEHPKIQEAVAIGIPDPYRGETVKVFIVLRGGETATEQEILDFCRAKLAKYKVPSALEFRDQLPKTLVGKFLRRVLQEEEKRKASG